MRRRAPRRRATPMRAPAGGRHSAACANDVGDAYQGTAVDGVEVGTADARLAAGRPHGLELRRRGRRRGGRRDRVGGGLRRGGTRHRGRVAGRRRDRLARAGDALIEGRTDRRLRRDPRGRGTRRARPRGDRTGRRGLAARRTRRDRELLGPDDRDAGEIEPTRSPRVGARGRDGDAELLRARVAVLGFALDRAASRHRPAPSAPAARSTSQRVAGLRGAASATARSRSRHRPTAGGPTGARTA